MIRVNREDLLHKLEQIAPGLSPREIVEQSSCVIFKQGRLFSFNEEIACSIPSDLPDKIEGAVQGPPLIAQLRKWNEEIIELDFKEEEVLITGKNRKAGIRWAKDIILPMDLVEKPSKWAKLDDDFADAVAMVEACASKDESVFNQTCVHITPNYMEAFDNYHLTRYTIKTPITAPLLVRRDSIKHILTRDVSKISETETWLHFKGRSGLNFSCLKFMESFENLDSIIKMKGTKLSLPKSLAEDVARAELFTQENQDSNLVTVEIISGKMRIRGTGASGWFQSVKKLKYTGKPRKFMVPPALLIELLKRHTECEIDNDKIKVDGGRFVYIASLDSAEESTKSKE